MFLIQRAVSNKWDEWKTLGMVSSQSKATDIISDIKYTESQIGISNRYRSVRA